MVSQEGALEVGEVYFGTQGQQTGQYLVLAHEGNNLKVRFSNSNEIEGDAGVLEKIVHDFVEEMEHMGLTGDNPERRRKFIRAVGYLAKAGDIRAVLTPSYAPVFLERYQQLTGQTINADSPGYSVLQSDQDVWGPELQIDWTASMSQMNQIGFGMNIQMTRPGGQGNYRITNNMFLYKLLEWGFVLGSKQDADRIRNRIPDYAREDFDKGLKY